MRRLLAIAAALFVVLLACVSIVGASATGQRFLAARIVAAVNGQIAGRVALERAALRLDGIRLEGVRVWAPGAEEPLLEARTVHVAPALTAGLLRGRVRVHDAFVGGARLLVETPAEGGAPGIARAFAPRDPAPQEEKQAGGASTWQVAIDRLAIEDGALVVREAGAPPQVDLDGLSLSLRGVVDADGAQADGNLAATLAAPVSGEASVEIGARLAGGYTQLHLRRLEGRIGGSTVSLQGSADLGDLSAELTALRVRLLPEDVPGLVPAWMPTVPLRVDGTARFANGTLATKLELVQEPAAPEPAAPVAQAGGHDVVPAATRAGGPPAPRHLRIDAELQPVAGTWRLGLQGASLDPRGFDARAPAGAVDLGVALRGAGLDDADGTIELPAVQLGAGRAGPIRLEGRWREERLDLRALSVALEGGSLQTSGWSGLERADLRFDLQAKNARRLVAELGRLVAGAGLSLPELPAVAGAARVQGRVHGPWAAPSVAATIRAADFGIAGQRFVGLVGDIDLAGLPADPGGRVSLRLERFESGSTRLEALAADLHVGGRKVRGTLDGKTAAGRLRADVDLAASADWQELAFSRLDLRWPRATWSLLQPLRLGLADGVAVRGLSVQSSHGARLHASGHLRAAGGLDLELEATGIDLALLPPGIAPAELGLAGRVAAKARLAGTIARPKGTVSLGLDGGALAGAEGIEIDAAVELTGRAVEARLRGGHGDAVLQATAQAAWPIDPKGAIALDADLQGLDLEHLAALLALPEPLAGRVAATAQLRGTLDDPRGTVEIRGAGLAARGLEEASARLRAELAENVRLEIEAAYRESTLQGEAAFALSPAALRRAPEAILAAPLAGSLTGRGLDLARLGAAFDLALRGRVELDAALSGTLRQPRGTTRLALVDGWNGEVGPLDASLELAAGADETRLTIESRVLGKPFLAGSLAAGAAVERLAAGDVEALRRTPLQGTIGASALEIGAVAWALGHRGETAGRVDGSFSLAGTAGAPELRLDTKVAGLSMGGVQFGDVIVDAAYARKELAGSVSLRGSSGGSAQLRGAWPVDLALPALAGGSAAALVEAPLDLTFAADQLDLAFLEGFSPDLRQAEGKLDGSVRVRGDLPLPRLEGALALRDARFGYTGYGDVRDVAVELEFTPEAIRLRRLEAGGAITASGAATRTGPDQPYAIDLQLRSKRFPLTTSDLVRGWVDAEAKITGTAGLAGVDARLDVSRARMELADTPSKDVQSLNPHPDFVIHRGGLPGLLAARGRKKDPRVEPEGDYPIVLAIASERPIQIEGTDVQLQASADLKMVVVGGSPQLAGSVIVEGGHVLVMSRRFEFSRGRVYYTGAEPPGDPRLDVMVRYESQYAMVNVTVGGTVQKPTTSLRSNPPLTEAEIAQLIATGRLQGKAGSAGAGNAASALGAVLTAQLKKGIAGKLPLDVISFQAGEDERDVMDGSRLEAGSYLTDRIYLGYARRFPTADEESKENANEVLLEYLLAPRWTLEMTYGDANVGGADLIWSRDF